MNPGMMGMNPGMFMANNNINNSNNSNNSGQKNLVFRHKTTQMQCTIHATDNETLGSVINKYINKSGDNHVNLYILNGKKLNESLTVAEAGIIDFCTIEVVAIDELEGALIK